jgi:hypothetical protein
MKIALEQVYFDPTIYPREIKEAYQDRPFYYHVYRYYKALKAGAVFPPIVLALIDGKNYLIDGYHRFLAHKDAGYAEIEADFIKVRSLEEAFYEAVKRNTVHGAPLGSWEMSKAAQKLRDMGFTDNEVSAALQISPMDLKRMQDDRIKQTDAGEISIKRPFVGMELPAGFDDKTQSPFATEFQTNLLKQVNALITEGLLDLGNPAVRAETEKLTDTIISRFAKRRKR